MAAMHVSIGRLISPDIFAPPVHFRDHIFVFDVSLPFLGVRFSLIHVNLFIAPCYLLTPLLL